MPLPGAPSIFPWLPHRFSPGEATVWVGPSFAIEPMLEFLYAGSATARGRISLIEGVNRFPPFRIGEIGRSLAALARAMPIPQLLTAEGGLARFPGLVEEGLRPYDDLVIGYRPNGLTLHALRDDASFDLVRRPEGRRGIDEFSDPYEREVMRWDAPRRRTDRRWRNG